MIALPIQQRRDCSVNWNFASWCPWALAMMDVLPCTHAQRCLRCFGLVRFSGKFFLLGGVSFGYSINGTNPNYFGHWSKGWHQFPAKLFFEFDLIMLELKTLITFWLSLTWWGILWVYGELNIYICYTGLVCFIHQFRLFGKSANCCWSCIFA